MHYFGVPRQAQSMIAYYQVHEHDMIAYYQVHEHEDSKSMQQFIQFF